MRKKFLTVLCGALLGLFSMNSWAQKDVTSTYLQNAGFDNASDFVSGSICTYAADVSTNSAAGSSLQVVTSWERSATGDAHAGGCFAFGTGYWVASSGMTVPATDKDGKTTGGVLGLAGCWDSNPYYTQTATLPAGSYKVEVCGYNAGNTTTFGTQTFGFKENGGTTHYISTTWTSKTWVTASVTFELSVETAGTFILGATKVAGGSAASAKLFIDYIKIIDLNAVDKTALDAAIEAAEAKYSATAAGATEFAAAIAAAQAVSDNASATVEQVVAAQEALAIAVVEYTYAAATPESPISMTSMIANPSFEMGNLNGWTNSGMQTQKNNSFDKKAGTYYAEKWQASGGLPNSSLLQTISNLPNGYYKITVAAGFDGSGAFVTANDDKTEIGANGDYYVITNVTNHTLELGVKLISSTANYFRFDNFRLEYTKSDPATYAAKLVLLQQIDAAKAISAKHSAASEMALQAAIATAESAASTATTIAEFNSAASALAAVVETVEASIADYAALQAAIAAASYTVITPTDNKNYVNLSDSVATAQGVYDAGTAESCADAIATLDAAVKAAKVADYNYVTGNFQYGVTLGTWTTTGYVSDFSNEHWSGINDKDHSYKNQDDSNGRGWNSSTGFEIGLNQDVTLPAGKYVFKACGRKSAGATMVLTVTIGSDELTVSDFPVGSAARGINKSGATSFDEDNDAYANNGNGYGWQWRFVPFELTEEATINVAVSASATTGQQWASFGNYSVLTNDEANIAMIAYNIALNDANTTINADANKNVTGAEKTALQTAIAADMTGKSKAEIEAATADLKTATQAFKDAAPSYDDFYAAKAEVVGELPYATAEKYAALQTALASTPATATDAVTAAAAIRKANRAYVESNSVAEGIEGIDWSNLVTNTDFVADLDGWASSQSGGTLSMKDGESPVDSYDFSYCYYDYWNGSANNQHASQTISNLPVGKYMLSVMARADTNLNGVFIKFGDQQTEVTRIGASGGVFGRGWNIYTVEYSNEAVQDVTIEVYSSSTGGNKSGWFGFTRVRLIKIQDYATMSINATAGWGTFAAPFDVTLPTGVTAYTIEGCEGNALTLSEAITGTLPAFTAALVYKEGGLEPVTFSGKATEQLITSYVSHYLVGVFQPTLATAGHYVLMLNGEGKAVFGQVVADDEPTIGANRCYLQLSEPEPPTQQLRLPNIGGSTHIQSVEQQDEAVIYDLTGRRVDAATKGIYIVNGKKMLVK